MSSDLGQSVARLNPRVEASTVFFERDECLTLGRVLHDEYVTNSPFPHIVIENFLPTSLLQKAVAEFPPRERGRFDNAHSRLKTGYQLEKIKGAFVTSLIHAFNGSQFIDFLEELTGIRGLLADPHQLGGGLHETARGGHLSIHADFNLHPRLNVRRRLNLILFLNENWQETYGGALELWRTDMEACEKAIAPIAGRAVIFNTESTSYHGHPEPLACPKNVYRRSIAMYYYTVLEGVELREPRRTTDFQVRPGTSDRRPVATRLRELARDLLPPMIYRALRKVR